MTKLSIKKFQEHLAKLDREELLSELTTLYKKYPEVSRHYQAELATDQFLLEKYKKKIYSAYFPKKGPGKRKHANIRKFISEFKKVAPFELDIIELQLYRVQCATSFFIQKGKQKSAYYDAVLDSFEEALLLIRTNRLTEKYKPEFERLLKIAPDDFDFAKRLAEIVKLC